jgi:hypothetical protein
MVVAVVMAGIVAVRMSMVCVAVVGVRVGNIPASVGMPHARRDAGADGERRHPQQQQNPTNFLASEHNSIRTASYAMPPTIAIGTGCSCQHGMVGWCDASHEDPQHPPGRTP